MNVILTFFALIIALGPTYDVGTSDFDLLHELGQVGAQDYSIRASDFVTVCEYADIVWAPAKTGSKRGVISPIDVLNHFHEFKDGQCLFGVGDFRNFPIGSPRPVLRFNPEEELSTNMISSNIPTELLTVRIDDKKLVSRTRAEEILYYPFPEETMVSENSRNKFYGLDSAIRADYPHCCGVVLRYSDGRGDLLLKLFLSDKAFLEREKYVKQAASMIRFKKKSRKKQR